MSVHCAGLREVPVFGSDGKSPPELPSRSRRRPAAWAAVGLLVLSLGPLAGCQGDEPFRPEPTCTDEWVSGLHIEIRDASTGVPAATGALIVAMDGSYVDTLDTRWDDLRALGAGERALPPLGS